METTPLFLQLVKRFLGKQVEMGSFAATATFFILKNWCFWTVVLEKTLESPLDCKEIQPVHSEDQPWVFFGRTDAEAETPILWPPHSKSWLIGKHSDAGRDWWQGGKGMTEDEMAGWHHWLDGHESEWTPGVGDGQGGLACCDSWSRKESDTTEWLNWTESWLKIFLTYFYVITITRDKAAIILKWLSPSQYSLQPPLLWNIFSFLLESPLSNSRSTELRASFRRTFRLRSTRFSRHSPDTASLYISP